MKQSQLFTKTTKDVAKEEVSINAQLLLRGGFINREMAGAYAYLPLGLRVLNNIISVIREEMNSIGGQELLLTALQDKTLWEKTNRWSSEVIDVWFRTELANGTELGLGNTHEEPVTALVKRFVGSYRDLPMSVYQFQTKFRNELRAKSGVLRAREFIMKDMYSFARTQEEHDVFYEQAHQAYNRIFERVGIGTTTHYTFASGGAFSKYSHEFQTITPAGEDIIYVDPASGIAVNEEVYTDEVLQQLGLQRDQLVQQKAIEVGNIFTLGTRFSEPLGLTYVDENGKHQPVLMGCYGIGPGRVLGTVVEVHNDDRGIIWPEEIAPFSVQIVDISGDSSRAEALYLALQKQNIDVLYDDRRESTGSKFADADLIGIPHQVIVSDRNPDTFEYRHRVDTNAVSHMTEAELINYISSHVSKTLR